MNNTLLCAVVAVSSVAFALPAPEAKIEFDYACTDAARKLLAQGFEAEDNWKPEEARAFFLQAQGADAKCLLAKVGAARNFSGPEVKKVMEQVLPLAASAPEVEKQLIAASDANRSGRPEKALELYEKLLKAHPQVYRAQMLVAGAAAGMLLYDRSIEAAKKAAELNPKAGAPHNLLGWTYTLQHKLPEAIAAYQKYVELAPKEPNAHDSLADAYLAAGKLPEALAGFKKAVDLTKTPFILSLDGVATALVLQGDLEGARAALTRYHDNAKLPWQKPHTSRFLAATWMIEGKSDKALAALDQAVAEGRPEVPVQSAYGLCFRAWYLAEDGKWNEALAAVAEIDKVPADTFNPGQVGYVAGCRTTAALQAHVGLGKLPDAEKDLATLKKALEGRNDPFANDARAYAEGLVALVKKDTVGATAAFRRCTDQAWECQVALINADPAGAKPVREQLLAANRRDPVYLVLRAKLLKAEPVKKLGRAKTP